MSVTSLNRAEIVKKLQELAKSPVPKDLAPGAMCYSVALPPERAEYVCPKCGEKTLYTNTSLSVWDLERHINAARRSIKKLKEVGGVGLNLDESRFCRKCSPEGITPMLVLQIQYDDGETREVTGISPKDLQLLIDFFSGKLVCDTGSMGERPLKMFDMRLRELLGLK